MKAENLDFSHAVREHWGEIPRETFGHSPRNTRCVESLSAYQTTTTRTGGGSFPATSGVGCDYASEPNSKVYAPRCSAGCFPTQLYLLGLLYQNQGLCAALRVHARSMPEAEVRSAANQVDSTGVPPSCTSLRGIGVRGVGGFAVVREICLRS